MNNFAPVSQITWGGLILAGGSSRRMGTAKSSLSCQRINGLNMLQHSCQQLPSVIAKKFILGKVSSAYPAEFSCIADDTAGAGALLAIQKFCADCSFDYLLILPVDMPLLSSTDLLNLVKHVETGGHRSCFFNNSRNQPGFPIVLHRSDFFKLSQLRHRKLFLAMQQIGASALPADIIGPAKLLNLNTSEQWQHFSNGVSND
ncbi:MAG: NTP transferase domain-containing protein [Planctomycetes bacterium]|nr:NTP transferase domain-containing protein [Planctomycetota bacterium]